MIEVIAFDGDDTLWHSESYFEDAKARYIELLAPYADAARLDAAVLATERRNLEVFGYGVKGFTLSLVETAIEVSGGRVAARDLGTIVDWGREMMAHPVELIDGVAETLDALGGDRTLALVTKGDLFHQESKLAASGLADRFAHVAIVSEKDTDTYRGVARACAVDPASLLMVGNSVRSDIVPALAAGASAAHVPYHVTWAHELAEVDTAGVAGARHHELATIREVVDLVAATDGAV